MKTSRRILEAKIAEKWMPKLDQKLSILGHKNVSESRKKTMAKMAHYRQIKEQRIFESTAPGYAFADLGNTPGRGAFNLGNNPNTGVSGFYNGPAGSAEVFQNLFDVFLEVASSCVAFDMFPTIPMAKSSGTIYIAEPIYAGGKLDDAQNKPLVIHVKATGVGSPANLVIGTTYTLKTAATGGENVVDVAYVGKHRVKGSFVFRLINVYNNSGASGTDWTSHVVADLFDFTGHGIGIYTSGGVYWKFDNTTVDYVEGFVNFVGGFSGAGLTDTNSWFVGRGDGTGYNQAMSRETGEKTYYRPMGIRTWSRNFSAETVHVDIDYTTEQIQDMEMDHGQDAREFGNSILQDQLTQHINDHLLGRLFAMGWSHHYAMNQINGFNMNANIALSSSTGTAFAFLGKDNTSLSIAGAPGVLPATGIISENMSTLQRRVVSRLQYGSGVINNRSRRGRGDISVMNTTFMSAIKDIRGFETNPFPNDLNDGAAYFAGSIYGIGLYEDPLMDLTDPRIALARKGNEKDPGIKFCPYILAEKISTIAEKSMAPKEALKSRYNVVEAGTNPELNYLTFTVESGNGYKLV